MKTAILDSPQEVDVATDKRFDRLAERIAALERNNPTPSANPSVASGPSKKKKPLWLSTLGGTLPLLTVVLGGIYSINGKIDSLRTDFYNLSTRVTKAEGAAKALADAQPEQTQKLIHDLLSAVSSEKPEIAVRAAASAVALTETLKRDKAPASSDFFLSATQSADSLSTSSDPALSNAAYQLQQQLAEANIYLTNHGEWRMMGVQYEVSHAPICFYRR